MSLSLRDDIFNNLNETPGEFFKVFDFKIYNFNKKI